jgi:hypothetical protein
VRFALTANRGMTRIVDGPCLCVSTYADQAEPLDRAVVVLCDRFDRRCETRWQNPGDGKHHVSSNQGTSVCHERGKEFDQLEAAGDAVVTGDLISLAALLLADPRLVRPSRVAWFSFVQCVLGVSSSSPRIAA